MARPLRKSMLRARPGPDDRLRFGIAILRVRVRFDPFPMSPDQFGFVEAPASERIGRNAG